MKETYEKLGIPEAERKYLAGVTAQYESEVVYHRNREDLERAGRPLLRHGHRAARVPRAGQAVLRHGHPAQRQQVRRAQLGGVVGRVVHLRAAGRRVRDAAAGLLPHQRREHGPVRAHADHRRRGLARCTTSRAARRRCTPPTRCTRPSSRSSSSRRARVTYTTIQNWSNNVFNLVTKRARVEAEGHMEWIDGNIGSKLTMKYPAVYLVGPKATGRGAVGGLRRRRPAPGRRGQDGPRRARDHVEDRVEVDLQGRRPHDATAASSGSRTTPTAARATCSATR